MPERNTRDGFIVKAQALHGLRYDYSQVVYINNKTKVAIRCPAHGVFQQQPNAHLSKQGCPKCGDIQPPERLARQRVAAAARFLKRAKAKHGDKYDYSQVEYERLDLNVLIGCRKHGLFKQMPGNHMAGQGCPRCSLKAKGINGRVGQSKFLARARAAHGNKYDYSQAEYSTAQGKLTIICPEHGPFQQTAHGHTRGAGCYLCAKSNMGPGWGPARWVERQRGRVASLYVARLYSQRESFYKIGITLRSTKIRLSRTVGALYDIQVVVVYKSQDAAAVWWLENALHKQYKPFKYQPLLDFAGQHECFSNITGLIETHLQPLVAEKKGTLHYPKVQQIALL